MSPTQNQVQEKENSFYSMFLDKAIGYAEGKVEGVQFKHLVAAAGVVVRQKQTRGAMKALSYQIARDQHRGVLPEQFSIAAV
jgi:hypothetical protein